MDEMKSIGSMKEDEYTVKELLDQLMADESWQPDPARRGQVIFEMMLNVFSNC